MSQQDPDPQRQKQAREYARETRRLFFLELAFGAVFLLALLLSGLSGGLRNFLDYAQPVRVALYFLVIVLSYGILSAPLGFYRSFVLPHRFGLSNQGWRAWLVDEAKRDILGLSLGMGFVVVIYLFLHSFPQSWWLLAFAFVTLVTVIMTRLAPVLFLPLFFRLQPLADPELRGRLLSLAERSKTSIRDVFQINLSRKTSAGNAMVMGWGSTRRIAISDTLLGRYTPEEIEVIMAHELGHHRHRDVARLIVAQSALMLLGFYLTNLLLVWTYPRLGLEAISDVAGLPMLALGLAAFALLVGPLVNAYSRYLEEAADRYALATTRNPEAFAAMLTKLADQNLAESKPSRWAEVLFYDHPPHYKRLELARRSASKE